MLLRLLILAFMAMAFPAPVDAWNHTGHMEAALVCYHKLPPDVQKRIFVTLGNHPNYSVWRQDYDSIRPTLPASIDIGMYLFLRASLWPDEIRRTPTTFNHPSWHFIIYPLKPPSFPDEPSLFPADDILHGIEMSRATLKDLHSSPVERAISLSWLIHLIGDIHEPLHCTTFIGENFPAPNGDRSGNDFYVRADQSYPTRLHSFWDNLGGSTSDVRLILNAALDLERRYPKEEMSELNNCSEPKCWSLESRQIAITAAYLDGNLKGTSSPDFAPRVPVGYTSQAKKVALRRISLAGYRLSNELSQLLKAKNDSEDK